MKIAAFIICFAGMVFVGCARHRGSNAPIHADSLDNSVGQRVILIGVAEPRKIGAALRGDDFYVYIDGLHDWPKGYVGRKVEVVGVLEERHDLPVFVQKPDEPAVQGIPVPEGTDLRAASRRLVIREATWRVLR